MATQSMILDPGAVAYTDDEIVGKVNSAAVNITRADAVEIAAILESATEKLMSDVEKTKLSGIDEGAEVNPADLDEVPDSATRKAMADTEKTKLAGVEDGAKDDQTGAEIKTAYEGEANAYSDTKNTKLEGIEDGAKDDLDGGEIRDLVVALTDVERKILVTQPLAGEFKVISLQRKADETLDVKYDDVPQS